MWVSVLFVDETAGSYSVASRSWLHYTEMPAKVKHKISSWREFLLFYNKDARNCYEKIEFNF